MGPGKYNDGEAFPKTLPKDPEFSFPHTTHDFDPASHRQDVAMIAQPAGIHG